MSLATLFVRRATFNKRFSEKHCLFPIGNNKNIVKDVEAAQIVLNDPEELSGPTPGQPENQAQNNAKEGSKDKDIDKEQNKGKEGSSEQRNKTQSTPRSVSSTSSTGDGAPRQQKSSPSAPESTQSGGLRSQRAAAGRGGFPNPLEALCDAGWNQLRKRYRTNNDQEETPLIEKGTPADDPEEGHHGSKGRLCDTGGQRGRAGKWGCNSNVEELSREQHVKLARLEVNIFSQLHQKNPYGLLRLWTSIDLSHDLLDLYDFLVLDFPPTHCRHHVGTVFLGRPLFDNYQCQ